MFYCMFILTLFYFLFTGVDAYLYFVYTSIYIIYREKKVTYKRVKKNQTKHWKIMLIKREERGRGRKKKTKRGIR